MRNVTNHSQEQTTMNSRLYTIPSPEALLSFLQQMNQPPDVVIQLVWNAEQQVKQQQEMQQQETFRREMNPSDWNQSYPGSDKTYH